MALLPPLQQALTPALQSMGDVAVLAIRKLTENMPAVQEKAKALADDIRNIAGRRGTQLAEDCGDGR